MSAWLISVYIEFSDLELPSNFLIQAKSHELAEAAVVHMGRTWWDECLEESDGCRWTFRSGRGIWFHSITQLDDAEASILQGLKFLDTWVVTGDPVAPRVRSSFGEDWTEFTR